MQSVKPASYPLYKEIIKIVKRTHSAEAVAPRCSVKKVFLKIFKNSQENTCARISFLIKFQASFTIKETLAEVFFCEFYKMFKNIIFTEHLWWLLLTVLGFITEKLNSCSLKSLLSVS